jgi:hypothetical protein
LKCSKSCQIVGVCEVYERFQRSGKNGIRGIEGSKKCHAVGEIAGDGGDLRRRKVKGGWKGGREIRKWECDWWFEIENAGEKRGRKLKAGVRLGRSREWGVGETHIPTPFEWGINSRSILKGDRSTFV